MYSKNLKEDIYYYFIHKGYRESGNFDFFTVEKNNQLKLHTMCIGKGLYAIEHNLNLERVYNVVGVDLNNSIIILKKKSIVEILIYKAYRTALGHINRKVFRKIKSVLTSIQDQKQGKEIDKLILKPIVDKNFTQEEIFYGTK